MANLRFLLAPILSLAVICLLTTSAYSRPQNTEINQALFAPQASDLFPAGSIVVLPKSSARATLNDEQKAVEALFPNGSIIVKSKGLSSGDAKPSESLDAELDDYDTPTQAAVYDPWEKWNRFWFRFNDKFYTKVAKPFYRGWEFITPKPVRTGLKNFYHNILFPVRFVNNLLQFRFKAAGVEFSRFMMNTMCSAGFADPASKKKTIVPMDDLGEDFGQTLGTWGIGHGPYVVWPFIGPSSLRDTVGFVADWFAEPITYVQPWWASRAAAFTLRFNKLDTVFPLYEDLTGAAIDPYISMRDAYIHYRNDHVKK